MPDQLIIYLSYVSAMIVRKGSSVEKVDSWNLFSQLVHHVLTTRSQRLDLVCLLCLFLSFCKKKVIFLNDCMHLWLAFTTFSSIIRSPGCVTCVFNTISALRTFLHFGFSSWWSHLRSPLMWVEVTHIEQRQQEPHSSSSSGEQLHEFDREITQSKTL